MSDELPKTYDPAAVEALAYRTWMEENAFRADPAAPGRPYTIVIPPPNVTGALHLGHAINNTLQDILTRQHRMAGFNTLWIPGIDHAGIATQAVVEKQLKEKENKTRHDVGREGLVERIWAWKQQYGDRIIEQLKRLGCSCDWSRARFTLDEQCALAVRQTFFKLFKDGLIYRGKRLVNWDVFLQTSVSDDEIYHETVKTSLWHIRYPIVGVGSRGSGVGENEDQSLAPSPSAPTSDPRSPTPTFMVVATTRPETMLGDTAVAVHPDDPRWNWAIGKFVKLPLTDRLIPIIGDPILVNMEFGSGCVKVTPAHDPNDYAVWQRQNGAIEIINILTPDGKINENGGPYAGMPREAARKKIVEDLAARGLLEKEEAYETQVGHSDRSKTPIEPYLSDQWFVKMAPLAEPALEVVREGTIKFFPERHAQQYLSWLGEKRDWPISRQLWWGHRIPVWRAFDGINNPKRLLTILKEWKDRFPDRITVQFLETEDCKATGADGEDLISIQALICLGLDTDDLQEVIESYGFVQDPDVLDTWFSSALWPHSTLGWPQETAELEKYYPTSVLLTGRDIITLWVARMVMMGIYNMGGAVSESSQSQIANRESQISGIPFHHVAINPTILDGKGERMSKSKGNGVDPVEIIETYGADALRFTLTQMATETQDVRLPVKRLADGRNTSEKFDLGRNFCNKLWNAARFALSNLENVPQHSPLSQRGEGAESLADRWILSRLARTIDDVNAALENYRFDQYAKACYDFFWRDFCDWYVETIKPVLKGPGASAQTANVLAAVLDGSLRLMHPMIPFITEIIWWKLNETRAERGIPGKLMGCTSPRLIHAAWPAADASLIDKSAERDFAILQELIAAIRNMRNEYKVEGKKSVAVSISADAATAELIRQSRPMLELLATCVLKEVKSDLAAVSNAARTQAGGCEIFVEGLIDEQAEQQRAAKRRDDLERQIAALKGRMSNEGYLAKAPPHLVKQTRDQLALAELELAKWN